MSAVAIAVVLATAVHAALAVLQALVAAGLPYGRLVWGGTHRVLPARLRIASGASILLYAAFTAVLLSRAGVLPGADTAFVVVATWVLVGYFVLGIVMNSLSRSRAERWTMVPVCVVLAASALLIAVGG